MTRGKPRWMETKAGTRDDRFSKGVLDQIELLGELIILIEHRRDELLPYTRGILELGDSLSAAGPLLYEARRLGTKKLALLENMDRAQRRRKTALAKIDRHNRLHHLIDTEQMYDQDAYVAAGIAFGIMMVKEHALDSVNLLEVFKSAGEQVISEQIATFADLEPSPKVAAA